MYSKEDPKSIQTMFNSIAQRYDFANTLLSFAMHRIWNRQLIRKVLIPSPDRETIDILDLCCGTGDIALGFLKNAKNCGSIYMLDFSSEMLAHAREKAHRFDLEHHAIHYLEADATAIPLPDLSIDRVTMAYGIRNIQNRDLCLSEIARTLRPGGIVGILELTRPHNKLLKFGHHLYLKTALPLLGRLATSNEDAYRYLCTSIYNFTAPEELAQQLQYQDFVSVTCQPLMGGIATLITAKKA